MHKKDCIFCKIATKEIKSNLILETDDYVSFHDLSPQAPIHALLIPKKHFESLNEIEDNELMGKMLEGAKQVAQKLNIQNDYRVVINTGTEAGQTVFHLHLHILGGRKLLWPPG